MTFSSTFSVKLILSKRKRFSDSASRRIEFSGSVTMRLCDRCCSRNSLEGTVVTFLLGNHSKIYLFFRKSYSSIGTLRETTIFVFCHQRSLCPLFEVFPEKMVVTVPSRPLDHGILVHRIKNVSKDRR